LRYIHHGIYPYFFFLFHEYKNRDWIITDVFKIAIPGEDSIASPLMLNGSFPVYGEFNIEDCRGEPELQTTPVIRRTTR